jgi:hypothetical protein
MMGIKKRGSRQAGISRKTSLYFKVSEANFIASFFVNIFQQNRNRKNRAPGKAHQA